jgi:hypothetical protein
MTAHRHDRHPGHDEHTLATQLSRKATAISGDGQALGQSLLEIINVISTAPVSLRKLRLAQAPSTCPRPCAAPSPCSPPWPAKGTDAHGPQRRPGPGIVVGTPSVCGKYWSNLVGTPSSSRKGSVEVDVTGRGPIPETPTVGSRSGSAIRASDPRRQADPSSKASPGRSLGTRNIAGPGLGFHLQELVTMMEAEPGGKRGRPGRALIFRESPGAGKKSHRRRRNGRFPGNRLPALDHSPGRGQSCHPMFIRELLEQSGQQGQHRSHRPEGGQGPGQSRWTPDMDIHKPERTASRPPGSPKGRKRKRRP